MPPRAFLVLADWAGGQSSVFILVTTWHLQYIFSTPPRKFQLEPDLVFVFHVVLF